MTREEALAYALSKKAGLESEINKSHCGYGNWVMCSAVLDFINACISALRPITREQVRRGKWEKIGADYRGQGGIWKCTACGKTYPYKCDFCPNCGAPMTDEAVDMVMERLEALRDE